MTKVIYHAPNGDAELVRMRGVRFVDGESVDLGPEHDALIGKLRGNPHFEVESEPACATGGTRFRAVHRGRGVFGIAENGTILDQIAPMTKADADAFNALTPDEQAAFVDKPADPPADPTQP